MTADCRLLFVYGTLLKRSPHPMARYLAERGAWLGAARITGRLYNLGRYPGLIEPANHDDWVHGDLYDLGDRAAATIAELDQYENAESPRPAYFERQLAEVVDADGTRRQAWVYWFRGDVHAAERIPSGRYL
ncbi:MAG: gamma-glutamylcyclotransferase [Gemmataceae bacterium]|nr:gamma-glutamylcyclotransferase [Gemmataceae bacterium]